MTFNPGIFIPAVIIGFDTVLLIVSLLRRRRWKKDDDATVEAITAYQRGDLDPWHERFESEHKKGKRHGYTFNSRYHEDPWEVGVLK